MMDSFLTAKVVQLHGTSLERVYRLYVIFDRFEDKMATNLSMRFGDTIYSLVL